MRGCRRLRALLVGRLAAPIFAQLSREIDTVSMQRRTLDPRLITEAIRSCSAVLRAYLSVLACERPSRLFEAMPNPKLCQTARSAVVGWLGVGGRQRSKPAAGS